MKQFLKIYLWQGLSLISGFAAMFIVTPFLSLNQSYFGIYTFVASLSMFLSYADFGFLSAGVKFASEAFANNERKEEEAILGFVLFIMAVVFFIFGLFIMFFAFRPELLLKGLHKVEDVKLARDLMFVFLGSLPILIAQRGIQLVFNLRLYDYLFQRVAAFLNLLKIASAFFFFRNGEYHIVEGYDIRSSTLCNSDYNFFVNSEEFYIHLGWYKLFSWRSNCVLYVC
jgi:O-antigen/teichoic acid export membrane protein